MKTDHVSLPVATVTCARNGQTVKIMQAPLNDGMLSPAWAPYIAAEVARFAVECCEQGVPGVVEVTHDARN